MSTRKRSISAVNNNPKDAGPSLLHRVRNMWQFANLCQWIYTFGRAAKIPDSIDIEEMEAECLKPTSRILEDIALSLLKLVSTHRGLTPDILDEQARKVFTANCDDYNPFGQGDEPLRFGDFDAFTKIRVLQLLTEWTMIHPERLRDKMEEQKDAEQTSWRIEPYGWDAEDRTYFVLDDNRVYRLTEPPPQMSTPKPKKSKTWRGGRRSSKRRRTTASTTEQADNEEVPSEAAPEDNGFGGMIWECVAVSLADIRSFLDGIKKTRDENEKILRAQLEEHLVPILAKQEESRKRKEVQRERELLNLAKMANAKRSSRIAGKVEQQKQEEMVREEERQRREAEVLSLHNAEEQRRKEQEREDRLYSREHRLREREARRRHHEEELAQLSEDSKNLADGEGRMSKRRLQIQIERSKEALEGLLQEEDWVFDCICGLYGQIDDGTHSIACETCNIWQHSKCLGVKEEDAERTDFHFICTSCRHRAEANSNPRPTIKLKVHHEEPSSGKFQGPHTSETVNTNGLKEPLLQSDTTANGIPKPGAWPDSKPRYDGVQRSSTKRPANGLQSPATVQQLRPHKTTPVKLGAIEPDSETQVGVSVSEMPTNSPEDVGSRQHHQGSPHGETTPALQTPIISRDSCSATTLSTPGPLPSAAGFSPTKQSPPHSLESSNKVKIHSTTTPILPPVTLSPSPQHQILTPPSKSPNPIRQPPTQRPENLADPKLDRSQSG